MKSQPKGTTEKALNNVGLRTALHSAAADCRNTLPLRLVKHPWKMVFPKILHLIDANRMVTARTFWGGRMRVVLPEDVSTVIWRYGFFERDVCLFLIHALKERMVFLDVGAHFGFFSLMASHLVGAYGRVYSLEPTPSTFELLQANVTQAGNITALKLAAFNRDGDMDFLDFGSRNAAFNSLFGVRPGAPDITPRSIKVRARSIDALVKEGTLPRFDVVKIDAESSELHVLEGMANAIRKFRPLIILEVGDFSIDGVASSNEVVQLLECHGYEVRELAGNEIKPHVRKETYQYGNLLFSPRQDGTIA